MSDTALVGLWRGDAFDGAHGHGRFGIVDDLGGLVTHQQHSDAKNQADHGVDLETVAVQPDRGDDGQNTGDQSPGHDMSPPTSGNSGIVPIIASIALRASPIVG